MWKNSCLPVRCVLLNEENLSKVKKKLIIKTNHYTRQIIVNSSSRSLIKIPIYSTICHHFAGFSSNGVITPEACGDNLKCKNHLGSG